MFAFALYSFSMNVGYAWSGTGKGVVLHTAPKFASQDCQRRVGYGNFPPPLAVSQQLSARRAGTGRGVDKLMGSPASVGSVGLRCVVRLFALALSCRRLRAASSVELPTCLNCPC